MTPEGIPDEVLLQAKLVWAQLLIHTHTLDIVRSIWDLYLINLEICAAELGMDTLFVQIELEDLFLSVLRLLLVFSSHWMM